MFSEEESGGLSVRGCDYTAFLPEPAETSQALTNILLRVFIFTVP